MSTRQNDFGGALSTTRIAARITAGCVTATSRARRVVSESIHPRTRSISAMTDSPPCGDCVGSDRQIVWLHATHHVAPPATAVQIGQPVVDGGVQAEQFGRLPGPLLRCAVGAFGDAEVDGRIDLAMADGVERFVGGKSPGRHRVGHRVRHEGEPDDLTHDPTSSARRGCLSSRSTIDPNTSPSIAHNTNWVPSEYNRNS
jgi:hypothetical protein